MRYAVAAALERLRDQVDLTVGIYHGGFERDLATGRVLSATRENVAYRICQELDLDILLTGHQHMSVPGRMVSGTFVVQPSDKGQEFLREYRIFITVQGSFCFRNSSFLSPVIFTRNLLSPHPIIISRHTQIPRIYHKKPTAGFGKKYPVFIGFVPIAPFLRCSETTQRITGKYPFGLIHFLSPFPTTDSLVQQTDIIIGNPPAFHIFIYHPINHFIATVKIIPVVIEIILVSLFIVPELFKQNRFTGFQPFCITL